MFRNFYIILSSRAGKVQFRDLQINSLHWLHNEFATRKWRKQDAVSFIYYIYVYRVAGRFTLFCKCVWNYSRPPSRYINEREASLESDVSLLRSCTGLLDARLFSFVRSCLHKLRLSLSRLRCPDVVFAHGNPLVAGWLLDYAALINLWDTVDIPGNFIDLPFFFLLRMRAFNEIVPGAPGYKLRTSFARLRTEL